MATLHAELTVCHLVGKPNAGSLSRGLESGRGLAGAVGTDEAEHLSSFHCQIEVEDAMAPPVVLGQGGTTDRRAGLTFGGVTDHVASLTCGRVCDTAPLDPTGEPGPTPPPQVRYPQLVDRRVGADTEGAA